MGEDEIKVLLAFYKALADESRLKILGLVSAEERSVGELATLLNLKEPTVSHHLAKLKDLDLVTVRAEGNTRLYRLKSGALEAMNKRLLSMEDMALWTESLELSAWDRKVLDNFFDQGRLKQIPAQRKKLDVILRWLAEQFEPGREYSEQEVNDLLRRHHADTATLRRELVGLGLLAREKGVYRRVTDAEGA